MIGILPSFLTCAALAAAGPILPRTVTALDQSATAEAQQRDDTATRAFFNTQIKTSDGRCLFVDPLSGDFRENLTPIQVGTCGATQGQGWDVITAGKHIDVANSMLIVSTLTEACANFDPRRAAGNQVLLFSCGGRADGSGAVTNSQLFSFNGTAGPLAFEPENAAGFCFTVKGNVIDIANCNAADPSQSFTFVGSASGGSSGSISDGRTSTSTSSVGSISTGVTSVAATTTNTAVAAVTTTVASSTTRCARGTRTVTVSSADSGAASTSTAGSGSGSGPNSAQASPVNAGGAAVVSSSSFLTFNPTSVLSVSRGGNLNPSAAAEANQHDNTATRAFSNAEIRAPNGQCLFIDPTAGDFRENLIPVGLVDCGGTPNEKWDVLTQGVHDNLPNSALVVNTLVQGCITFDGRRATNDTVNLFSCGGRADGSGQTQVDQLFPFIGELSFAFAPEGENNKTCILPGAGKLISGACPTDGSQLFSIFP